MSNILDNVLIWLKFRKRKTHTTWKTHLFSWGHYKGLNELNYAYNRKLSDQRVQIFQP